VRSHSCSVAVGGGRESRLHSEEPWVHVNWRSLISATKGKPSEDTGLV